MLARLMDCQTEAPLQGLVVTTPPPTRRGANGRCEVMFCAGIRRIFDSLSEGRLEHPRATEVIERSQARLVIQTRAFQFFLVATSEIEE